MKKDINKLLSRTCGTYMFILILILVIKIIGLDYFGLDLSNPFILKLTSILKSNRILNNIFFMIPLTFNQYVILSLSLNDNSKKLKVYNLILIPIYYIVQCIKLPLFGNLSASFEILYFFITIIIYNKTINKQILIKFVKVICCILIFQTISTFARFNYTVTYVNDTVANALLNLDYIIMLIIMYKLNFMKGDEDKCGFQEVQYLFLHQQHLSKKQSRKYQIKSLNSKEKFEFILCWIFYLLWNLFTVFIILLFAKFNGTLIECILILSSFLINKTVFGKPFHMKRAIDCFIVSNLSYYILNRITTPLGISIFVPVFLGIFLSYITSKLVKDNKQTLKRGMTEAEINYLLNKIDVDPIDYKICKLFYVDRLSDVKIAMMLNYSEISIKKRKQKINNKLKELII